MRACRVDGVFFVGDGGVGNRSIFVIPGSLGIINGSPLYVRYAVEATGFNM